MLATEEWSNVGILADMEVERFVKDLAALACFSFTLEFL